MSVTNILCSTSLYFYFYFRFSIVLKWTVVDLLFNDNTLTMLNNSYHSDYGPGLYKRTYIYCLAILKLKFQSGWKKERKKRLLAVICKVVQCTSILQCNFNADQNKMKHTYVLHTFTSLAIEKEAGKKTAEINFLGWISLEIIVRHPFNKCFSVIWVKWG